MSEKVGLKAKTSENKGKDSVAAKPKENFYESIDSPVEQILHLQRTIGNQAVQRLIKSGTIQAKLKIGKPNDKYEMETDGKANKVAHVPEAQEEEKEKTLQTKGDSPQSQTVITSINPQIQRRSTTFPEEHVSQPRSEQYWQNYYLLQFKVAFSLDQIELDTLKRNLGIPALLKFANQIYFNHDAFKFARNNGFPGILALIDTRTQEFLYPAHARYALKTKPLLYNLFYARLIFQKKQKQGQLINVLNTADYKSDHYRNAVAKWPDYKPIWKHLKSRRTKENFIRYIVSFDLTDCRPYFDPSDPRFRLKKRKWCEKFARAKLAFTERCTGFAVQMYVRYNAEFKGIKRSTLIKMRDIANIFENNTAAKFRIPIFIVQTPPGHAFNAALVGSNQKDINSYLFIEPQSDIIFDARSFLFKNKFKMGLLTIEKQEKFITRPGGKYYYKWGNISTFVQSLTGRAIYMNLNDSQRSMYQIIVNDIFIAEDEDGWRHRITKHKLTFDGYMRQRVKKYPYTKYSDKDIAFIGKLLIGRKFRKSPNEKNMQELTRSMFIQLMNRPSLNKLIPQRR